MQAAKSLRSKFREYSQKAIINRMPCEYIGIAKQYSTTKKQRVNSQQIFDAYFHEARSIQKINENLAKSLSKKKKQLKYQQSVRSRYVNEVLNKQKLKEMREQQLDRLKNKTLQEKCQSQLRTSRAKEVAFLNKKNQYSRTKSQLMDCKSQRLMNQLKLYEKNQSRVKQIECDKVRIKDYYNKFYQNKNKKYMQSYNQLINKQKKSEQRYKNQTKNLQIKLLLLKQQTAKKQKQIDILNSSMESLRDSRAIKSSRQHFTTRSMTPIQILSNSENPQKQKRPKLIVKV